MIRISAMIIPRTMSLIFMFCNHIFLLTFVPCCLKSCACNKPRQIIRNWLLFHIPQIDHANRSYITNQNRFKIIHSSKTQKRIDRKVTHPFQYFVFILAYNANKSTMVFLVFDIVYAAYLLRGTSAYMETNCLSNLQIFRHLWKLTCPPRQHVRPLTSMKNNTIFSGALQSRIKECMKTCERRFSVLSTSSSIFSPRSRTCIEKRRKKQSEHSYSGHQ